MILRLLSAVVALVALQVPSFAQTNPAAQSLPYSQNFGTADFGAPLTGMAAWVAGPANPYSTLAAAEASTPSGDAPFTSGTPSGSAGGGQYGHAVAGNGRQTTVVSGNSTNGTTQIALAINTTGASSVTVAYDLGLTFNTHTRDIGFALQYRVGTTGAFTTVTGSDVVYGSATSNGGDADATTDLDSYTFNLPAAAANQPVVQLRWISWRGGSSGSTNQLGIDNISVTSGAATPCTEPTAQPTGLTLTPGVNNISGSFTAASPAANQYLVVRSTSATLTASPVDGTTYTAGGSLGGGTVVQVSNATTFNTTGLTASTQYYFFVFSLNNQACTGGPNYFTTSPLSGNATTSATPGCLTPNAGPTSLVFGVTTSSSINGSFTSSASANRYLVVRSTAATLSATPVNGVTYVAGAAFGGGTIVQYGTSLNFSDGGLTAATTYNYFVFAANGACVGEPFYFTTALTGSQTTATAGGGLPATYYNAAAGLNCQALKTALFNIVSAGTTTLSYTPGVWNAFGNTDITRNFENNRDIMFDMYSNIPGANEPYEYAFGTNQCGNYAGEGDCYNREHSFPASWFNDALPMFTDIHQLYPTDGFVNNIRGNLPYGKVATPNTTTQNGSKRGTSASPGYTGIVFEPRDEFKGDFARAQLYMAVRYENLIASWQSNGTANEVLAGNAYPAYDEWYIKQMYEWHIADPVSAKEIARNNAAFLIQGNRNPFVDSAQFVQRIWSCTGFLPAPPPTPVVINVNNKCFTEPNARGKVTNPPAGATVAVTLDGSPIAYASADSSFQYFTSSVTPIGNRTVRVTYTNSLGSSFRDTIYNVASSIAPTINISGTTTVSSGTFTNLSSNITSGGTSPGYQWQDSTSAVGWVNVSGGNLSTLAYVPGATGNKIRCRLTSNATGCVNTAPVFSNVLTFTVNTATAITPVNGSQLGIKLMPNPVQNELTVTDLRITDRWNTAEVMSLNGKTQVLKQTIVNQNRTVINVEKLAAGMYVLVLRKGNGESAFFKFIKM
jgi:endonuclease I